MKSVKNSIVQFTLLSLVGVFLLACGGGGSSSGGGDDTYANISGTWSGMATFFSSQYQVTLTLVESGNAKAEISSLKQSSSISGTYTNGSTGWQAEIVGSRSGNNVTLNLTNHDDVGSYQYQMQLTVNSNTNMTGVTRSVTVSTGAVVEAGATLNKL